MAAETGFMIDGRLYPVPSIDTFTMDEAQVLYDYAGLSLEDFVSIADDDPDRDEKEQERSRRFRNPALLRALLHVAYQRGNPNQNPRRVEQIVGALNIVAALEQLGDDDEEVQPGPPASTTEPDGSSPNGSVGSSASSGSGSSSGSDAPDDQPAPTTPSRSDTSSISPPISSAA